MVVYRLETVEQEPQFEYETFIDFTYKHFLQSEAWDQFQRDLGKKTFYIEKPEHMISTNGLQQQ